MRRSVVLLLTCILLAGAWLRLDRLTEIPPSFYCDEVAVSYDAWSIATYGKDQWGETMPFAFRSFGDYKSPVDFYTSALFIKLFGYSDLMVRLPSAVMGIAGLLLLFFVARLLLQSEGLALLSVGLLAISPWHIQFSRQAWQTNYALDYFLLAMVAFLYAVQKNGGGQKRAWLLVLATALLGIDLYTYHAPKVFVPVFVLIALVIYRQWLWMHKRVTVVAAAVLLSAALLGVVVRPEMSGLVRYQGSSYTARQIQGTPLYRMTGVEALGRVNVFAEQYFSDFSLQFLFQSGDTNPRHSTQRVGETYWYDLLLLPVGLLALLRRRKPTDWLLVAWLFLSPLAGAVTTDPGHAGRALYALGSLQMVSAVGLGTVWQFARRKWKLAGGLVVAAGMSAAITASVLTWANAYFNIYPVEYSRDFEYGLMRAFTDYGSEFDKYDHIFVSDYDEYSVQAYMLALHYMKYDPEKFRASVQRDGRDPLQGIRFGKFVIGAFDPQNAPPGKSLIFASPREALEPEARRGQVRYKDGTMAFAVYEYSK